MEKLAKAQSKTGKAIEKRQENFYKTSKSRKNLRYLRTQGELLERDWVTFDTRHKEILTYEAAYSDHPYFEEDFYTEVQSIYEDFKAELEDNAKKLELNPDPNEAFSTAPTVSMDTADDLQRKIRTQRALMSSLERSLKILEEALESPQSRAFYQQHLTDLGSYWQAITTTHHEIMAEEETSQYDEGKYTQLELRYRSAAIKLLELSDNTALDNRQASWHSSNMPQLQPSGVRLPKITIPTFTGDYSKWNQFHDLFLNLIHLQSISDSQKMFYLKSNLAGEPSRLIQHLQISDANYKTAWDILQNRYNNKRLIVSAFLNNIFLIPSMNGESVGGLKRLHDTVNESLLGIRNQGLDTANWDALILHILLQRIDRETHRLFEQNLDFPREIPKLSSFLKFIESRFQLLETLGDRKERAPTKDKELRKSAFLTTKQSAVCNLCRKQHFGLRNCTSFLKLPVTERIKMAKRLQCCLNCLKKGHSGAVCPSRGCLRCDARHNTLLHQEGQEKSGEPLQSNTQQAVNETRTVHTVFNEKRGPSSYVFLGTAVINVENSQGNVTTCRAILDSGSQLNFISERLIKKLGFNSSTQCIDINGIGHFRLQAQGRANIAIGSKSNGFSARIEVFILPEITSEQPSLTFNTSSWPIPKNICLADPNFNKPMRVDLLLGAEIYCSLMSIGQIKLSPDLPTLQNTVFGWIVLGRAVRQIEEASYFSGIGTKSLESQLERFWELEQYDSNQKQMTEAEKRCEDHFNKHTYRNYEGRFVVKLPFITSPDRLGNSREIAIQRFLSLERRLKKDPPLRHQYKDFIKELLELNHMEPITKIPDYNYFLPHHCILKPESTTTKLRVVFDGSCKASNNLSLNDILLTGPTIQNELFTILLRFRLHKYVFTADINKMYRQILVSEEDRNFQLIVWRDMPSENLRYYRLRTVTYGTSAAPYLAVKCLQRLAEDEAINYPLGSKILKRDFYVDDVMTGSDNLSEAIKIQTELSNILQKGGFLLRKWCANHIKLLQSVPKEDIELMISIGKNDENQVKTLGLMWCPSSDQFSIKTNLPEKKRITKRTILSDIAHIYDPLGLVNPVVTLGKIFLQQLWQLKLDWDEAVPQELHSRWLAFREDLRNLKSLFIPRHVLSDNKVKLTQIHAFSDASEKAYGTAIYIRSYDEENRPIVKLLCAKSKVAPIKKTTLPRLELAAAQLMVKLVRRLKDVVHLSIEDIHYWTDSTIALSWIQSSTSSFKTFVANRVSYIQQHTTKSQWHHVSTKQNPADLVSRGLSATQLVTSTIWFTGPEFLQENSNNWANYISIPSDTKGEKQEAKLVLITTRDAPSILSAINHRNSFRTLQHIICYIKRFANIRQPREKQIRDKTLQATELHDSLMFILREIQRTSFPNELKQLSKQQTVASESKVYSLLPFLDNSGLMRVGGRLRDANLPYDARHPILLPSENEYVRLLVTHLHEKHLHAGPQALLAIVRQQFWPLNGKRLAQSIVHKCIRCARLRPRFITQLMGNLPAERVQPSRPFVNVGVDLCGPVQIHYKIRGKCPTKAYIAVFICFSTKAVHLELVSDLTKNAFIGALKRFIGRRGRPSKIYCDNATNFVGAKNELKEVQNLFSNEDFKNEVTQHCADEYIQWCFIPPRTPHFGGLWEAAVKSAKYHLRRTLWSASLTYEELNTVIIEIEAILNSRPLTPLSNDPSDIQALTPGHFLIGEPLTTLSNPYSQEREAGLVKRWELVKHIQAEFWKRWSKEYLQQLQQRSKWQRRTEGIKPGTLVLLKEETTAPQKWPLGKVTQEYRGSDGLTRVVEVKTERGIVKRAIHNLCPLPIETNVETRVEEQAAPNEGDHPKMEDSNKLTACNMKGSALLSGLVNHRLSNKATQRTHPKKGRFLPINPLWLQAPFKASKVLQKYNRQSTPPKSADQPETKRPRKQLSMGTKLVSLLLSICIVYLPQGRAQSLNETIEVTPWKSRPLMFFENIAQMSMATDNWNIVAYYDLNGYWKEINSLKIQLNKLKDICNHSTLAKNDEFCKPIIMQFQRQMDIIQLNNEILLRRNGHSSRIRRSPLDIIGTITNKLFGILDQEYANQMSETINKVKANEDHLLELIKSQTSIIDSTANIIKRDREFSDKQFSIITNYMDRLQMAIEVTNRALTDQDILQIFNTLSIHSTLIMVGYQQIQSALIEVITDCHNGKINPLLLTPEQLRKELVIIRENIPSTLTITGGSDHIDLLELYRLMTVQTRVTTEYVLFDIHLPLLNKDVFQIFNVVPVPIKINNKIVQISSSTNFLAVSLHRDYYYPMSEDEISRCITNAKGNYICSKKHRTFHKTAGEAVCELSVLNHDNELPEDCTLETVTASNTWIQLHDPNSWIYVLEQECVLNIVCGIQTQQQTLLGAGLLKFKSNCIIKQDSITISAHSRYSSKLDSSYIPSITINDTQVERQLLHQDVKAVPHGSILRNNTDDINSIKDAILRLQAEQGFPQQAASNTHHYTISYLALTLILILIIVCAARKLHTQRKLKCRSDTPPEPTPRRSHFQLKTRTTTIESPTFKGREDV